MTPLAISGSLLFAFVNSETCEQPKSSSEWILGIIRRAAIEADRVI